MPAVPPDGQVTKVMVFSDNASRQLAQAGLKADVYPSVNEGFVMAKFHAVNGYNVAGAMGEEYYEYPEGDFVE